MKKMPLLISSLFLLAFTFPTFVSASLATLPTLKYGDIRPEVRTLQETLNSIGQNITRFGEETTRFGEKTLFSIKDLQCTHNIACAGDPSHGVFGPQTKGLLMTLQQRTLSPRVLGAATDGLVAHYAFDGSTSDSAGSNSGTAIGGPTYGVGKIGQAIQMDGVDDYVNMPDIIEGLSAITVSGWVKTNDLSGKVQRIIKQTGGGADPINFDFAAGTEGNDYKFRCVIGNVAVNISSGNTAQFKDTNWHHVACVYNGTDIRVYVDGSLSNSPTAQTGTLPATANDLVISSDVAGEGWSGNLDDFRIYNRALTATEIYEIYNLSGDTGGGSMPANGQCSATRNQCAAGSFLDVADSSANYLWKCAGSSGGATASCSLPIAGTETVASTVSFPSSPSNPSYSFGDLVRNNTTWVFLGDSITDAHLYSDYLESYFQLRYPNLHMRFRGEGRGGGTVAEATTGGRYDRRAFSWSPDVVSVMFGHNGNATPEEYKSQLLDLADNYILAKNSAIPVLFGPHPAYTSTGKPSLGAYSDKVTEVGNARGWVYADIWHYLQPLWSANLASSNPVDLIAGGDAVHVGEAGHLGIAYSLLQKINAEREVSSATINAGASTPVVVSETQTDISGLIKTPVGIDFNRLDSRLPMAYDDAARDAFRLHSGIADFNKYMLTVTGLDPGTYEVYIGAPGSALVKSATVDSAVLSNGWNMSTMSAGPIYEQLQEVLGRIRDKGGISRTTRERMGPPWKGEAAYKSEADAAYNNLGLRGEALRAYLAPSVANVNILDDRIWQAAQPKTYAFSLRKINGGTVDTAPVPTVTTGAPASAKFFINDRVMTNIDAVNVRGTAAGLSVGTQPASRIGTVIGGPITAMLSSTNYIWWNINFDGGVDGWVAEKYLDIASAQIDVAAPVLSGATPAGTLAQGAAQAILSVTTDESATCKYGTSANTAYSAMANTFSTTGTKSHSATLTGLANGNSYAYYVRCKDVAGNANAADYVISFSVSNQSGSLKAWSYPGVPYTDWAYDPFTHAAPARPAEWPGAAKQDYYFIAPNDARATDAVTAGEPVDANGKRFGYPDRPRKTLPIVSKNFNSYPAGTVFWMKGGEYNTVFGTGDVFNISSRSTSDKPFWVYGDPSDKPVFRNARILIYNSSYGFIENIIFDDGTKGSGTMSFGRSDAEGDTHHVTVRNIEIKNRRYTAHGGLISVDAPGGTVVNGDIHDIVFYKINFKNNGGGVNWNAVDADMHGYKLNGDWNQNRAYRIWVIENDVRKGGAPDPIDGFYKSLAGNFMQVGDQNVNQGNVDHVWIAGNYSEGTRQGCIGFKRSGHAVASSNVCRDLAQTDTSQGQAFNIKYDRQENLWFVNNYVENVDSFIIRAETTSSGAGGPDTFSPIDTRVHIIGNVFKNNMRQPWNAPDMGGIGGWKTKGISIQDMNGKVYIANNVIDTSVYGVYFDPHSQRQSAGSEMHVYNNIAVNLSAGLDTSAAANNGIMVTTDTASEWFIENNLVDSGRFYYSGTQYNSAAAFNSRVNASGNIQGDPMFANPGAGDYSLLPGSPAIDAGIRNYTTNGSPDVYQLFINAFANDPDFPGNPADVWPRDRNKNARVLGSNIDMGAYESNGIGQPASTPFPSDIVPPVISNPLPSGSLPQNTTQTSLSVTTNEAAMCKYGTIPNSAFASMANTLTATGNTHSASLTGLQSGQAYNYHVRCKDVANNANVTDYTVRFSVGSASSNLDSDSDGVLDNLDLCPNTPSARRTSVNRLGCIRPRINASVFDIRPDSDQDIRMISNLRLGRTGIGEVRFDEPVTLVRESEQIDIDANLILSSKKIELRSAQVPELNRRAVITLYGITEANPKILKDGTACTTCTITAFDRAARTIVFTVPGFSTYEVVEGEAPPIIVPPVAPSTGSGSYAIVYGNGLSNPEAVACSPGQAFNTATGQKCAAFAGTNSIAPNQPLSAYAFARNLAMGAKGEDVRRLQVFLNANGFAVAPAGAGSPGNETLSFGPATRAALARYQAARGIRPAAGFFGPTTRASVSGSAPAPAAPAASSGTTLRLGSSGPAVKSLRQKLRAAGYLAPYGSASDVPASAAAETSAFGATTESALRKFQCEKGIACSGSGWGIAGPATRAALGM